MIDESNANALLLRNSHLVASSEVIMGNSILVTESTLTDRYQTTVPDSVRKALHLNKREKIRYTIQPDGSVLLSKANHQDVDPALNSFLSFLAEDIQQNPQHLKAVTPELMSCIENLISDVVLWCIGVNILWEES